MGRCSPPELVPEFVKSMLQDPHVLHKEGPSTIRERMLVGFKQIIQSIRKQCLFLTLWIFRPVKES